MSYAHLVLATGSRPRPLRVPGGQLDGVLTLRTVADAEEIVQRLAAARRLVVVGGGFIGLEVAAVAGEMGVEVTVVEILPRLMARAVSTAVSSFYAEEHSAWGTRILLATGLARVLDNGRGKVAGVETDDGTSLEADLVLAGIGVVPNTELAESCGLPCRNGIVVDSHLRTEDDRISAVGDCVRFPSPFADDPVRLESVQNAGEQARSLAARLTGHTKPYQNVPWFWSDQRDLKMQLAGLTGSADQTIVRGNPAERSFSVFCFRRGILLGVESVNRPSDHAAARRLLGMETERRELRPVDVAQEDFDLKSYVRAISSAPVPIRAG